MIRGLITLLLLLVFIGLVIWVFRPKNRQRFEDDAKLPFMQDADDGDKDKEETRDE